MVCFNCSARVLVATTCASMGLDVKDVRVVVNVGIPSSDWVLEQQSGRAGRDSKQAVTVSLCRRARKPKCMTIGAEGNTYVSFV